MKSEMHMSNLNLPSLKHSDLRKFLGTRPSCKLAFATYALNVHGSDVIQIKHHDSIIAEIQPDHIELDNHGFESQTTAARMDRVLRDNGFNYRIAIRQREMSLLDNRLGILHRGIRTVTAHRNEGVAVVQSYAG